MTELRNYQSQIVRVSQPFSLSKSYGEQTNNPDYYQNRNSDVRVVPARTIEFQPSALNVQKHQPDLCNPCWLKLYGSYDIIMCSSWSVVTALVVLRRNPNIPGAEKDSDDIKFERKLFAVTAIALLSFLLYLWIMVCILLTAIGSTNPTKKKNCLVMWQYSSYAQVVFDFIFFSFRIHLLTGETRINNLRKTGTLELTIVEVVFAVADILLRVIAIYATGKFVKQIKECLRI